MWGKWDISRETKYDGNKPSDSWQEQEGPFDSYDPVVGKWMINLVATTPITAKAMKSLYAELNRQKDLKRSYRRRYKDLQAVVSMTTNTPVSLPLPVITTSNKANLNPQVSKATPEGQYKKGNNKGKDMKALGKGKKSVTRLTTSGDTPAGPSAN